MLGQKLAAVTMSPVAFQHMDGSDDMADLEVARIASEGEDLDSHLNSSKVNMADALSRVSPITAPHRPTSVRF
jgi:hypothetical protein